MAGEGELVAVRSVDVVFARVNFDGDIAALFDERPYGAGRRLRFHAKKRPQSAPKSQSPSSPQNTGGRGGIRAQNRFISEPL